MIRIKRKRFQQLIFVISAVLVKYVVVSTFHTFSVAIIAIFKLIIAIKLVNNDYFIICFSCDKFDYIRLNCFNLNKFTIIRIREIIEIEKKLNKFYNHITINSKKK